jgi:signal transduction histidine kinase/ABC-type uncharacterized transport system substrate-binding protein
LRRLAEICGFIALATFTLVVHAEGKAVLTIFGGEARTPAYETLDRVFRERLAAREAPQFYTEYLDTARFPGPTHERQMADYLRTRYSGKRIDLLVAVDSGVVRFLKAHGDDIYPGVPVVYYGVRDSTLRQIDPPGRFVGVPEQFDPAPTISLALALRPRAREIVAVTGTAELDRAWEARLRETSLPAGVRMRLLTGASIDAIEREVAALKPDSVVVVASFRRDGAGTTFPGSTSVVERLRRVSAVPVFHLYDTGVGRGAAATYSVPQEALAAKAARMASQVLEFGVESVVPPTPGVPVPIVDWREVRQWDLDTSKLPPETEFRFRTPGFWDEYRYHVLAIAALVLLETALIAGLLLQRVRRLSAESRLQTSEDAMQLAANAAQLVLWTWNIERDEIWFSDNGTAPARMLGTRRTLGDLLDRIHPEDRTAVQRAISRACLEDVDYECEYRVVAADGATHWFAGRGRVEHVDGAPRQLRGITLDITRRKAAELDAQHQRNELAHLSRVTMLGELSSSVAHELNQPLMAILSNAQAARMFISRDTIDLVELGSILDDIVENDKRAGEIIWGLRKMLKKEDAVHERLSVNEVVQEVLRLMRGDLMNRGVVVESKLAGVMPTIKGDRIQLQQVVLNLIVNACDAMAAMPREARILVIRTESAGSDVRVSVVDRGTGIAPESLEEVFKPFYSTKKHGLGLGLSVCRSIVASHGGELAAANNPGGGATFTLVLHQNVRARAVA